MKTFEYVALRAIGVAIIVGLSVSLGLILGLVGWLSDGAHAGRAAAYLGGFPVALGLLALVTNTPIARWLTRDVENVIAILLLLIFIALPFWLLIYPVQLIALRLGWVQRVAA